MFIQNSNQWLVYLFYYATGLATPGDLGVYSLVDRVREFAKWRAKMKTGEWGSYNTYSKENKELMAAEFWFTLKLNFRFLFILQII